MIAKLGLILLLSTAVVFADKLGSYNVNIRETSVSGLSSGGYFAVQMHVAYSSIMKGAGIFAGGPYDCAQGSLTTATTTCMKPIFSGPDATSSIRTTDSRVKSGVLDNTDNLKNQKVFLFTGVLDTTVKPLVMTALNKYYTNYVDQSNIVFENTIQAAHTQPTDNPVNKNSCATSASPYLSNCNYDGAGKALNHIYGKLNPRTEGEAIGQVISFDQTEFNGDDLDSTGYLFVPQACANGAPCKLHVSFHGCVQNYATVRDAYIDHSGYNQWADTNNIIVLYPQTSTSATNSCWNWWGYDGDTHYDDQGGSQMSAVKKMIDRITAGVKPGLNAPANVHSTAQADHSISLAWDAVTGADGYHVFRDETLVSDPLTVTEFTDITLAAGTPYSYQVSAFANKADGNLSPVLVVKTTGQPPDVSPPVGLSALNVSSTSLSVTWTAEPKAVLYTVYCNDENIGTSDTNSFSRDNLAPDTLYAITVTATDSDGHESAKSKPLQVKTYPSFKCQEFTSSNFAHVLAGRASDKLGTAYAVGSGDKLGFDNVFIKSTVAETSDGYFVEGYCPTSKN